MASNTLTASTPGYLGCHGRLTSEDTQIIGQIQRMTEQQAGAAGPQKKPERQPGYIG
jgi:hypothetical protein